MRNLNPAAISAILSLETDKIFITLVDVIIDTKVMRITDGYTHKFIRVDDNTCNILTADGTDTPVESNYVYTLPDETTIKDYINDNASVGTPSYGVYNESNIYLFLPFNVVLPSDDEDAVPTVKLSFFDVARYLIPEIRSISSNSVPCTISVVLSSDPSIIEITLSDMYLTNIEYNTDSVEASIAIKGYSNEPFPCHSMTPSYFPGIF